MRAALIVRVALIAIGLVAFGSRANATPTEDLDSGREMFRHHDYQSAIKVLNFLIYPDLQLVRQDQTIECYVLLGASLYEIGNRQRAAAEFRKALQIDIDRSITTLTFSEGAVKLFDDTKAEVKVKLEQDAERKRLAEREQRIKDYVANLRVYETHPYYVNFVPFGAGQFQNKQRTKGILFFGSELVTFGASAGIFLYLGTKYGLVAKVPLEEGARVRRYQQIEIATGLAFLGIHAYGVVDSLLHYKSRAQIKGDDSLIPSDLLDPEKPPAPKLKKTSLRDRLHIGPMLTPSGFGIGIGLEN